jgi:hypothetical protein
LERVDQYAFASSAILRVQLPKSVRILDVGCFLDCVRLTEVLFGEGLKIGEKGFECDLSLKALVIPGEVIEIGGAALSEKCRVVVGDGRTAE